MSSTEDVMKLPSGKCALDSKTINLYNTPIN